VSAKTVWLLLDFFRLVSWALLWAASRQRSRAGAPTSPLPLTPTDGRRRAFRSSSAGMRKILLALPSHVALRRPGHRHPPPPSPSRVPCAGDQRGRHRVRHGRARHQPQPGPSLRHPRPQTRVPSVGGASRPPPQPAARPLAPTAPHTQLSQPPPPRLELEPRQLALPHHFHRDPHRETLP